MDIQTNFDEIAKKFATLSPDKFKQRMNEIVSHTLKRIIFEDEN